MRDNYITITGGTLYQPFSAELEDFLPSGLILWSSLLDFLASSLSLRCLFFLISAKSVVSCIVNSFLFALLGDLERDLDL